MAIAHLIESLYKQLFKILAMKKLSFISLLFSLLFLVRCTEEKVFESVNLDSNDRILSVAANFSLDDDTNKESRSINKDPNSLDIVLLWDEGETEIKLVFKQDENIIAAQAVSLIQNVSNDRKSGTFDVVIPLSIDINRPFDLYGACIKELQVIDGKIMAGINEKWSMLPDNTSNNFENCPIWFETKNINLNTPLSVSFKHLGAMGVITVKNTTNTLLDNVLSKIKRANESDDPFYYEGSAPFVNLLAITDPIENLTNTIPTPTFLLPANATSTFTHWIYPNGNNTPEIKVQLNDATISLNALPNRGPLEIGKAYYIYAVWDSETLTLTDSNFETTSIVATPVINPSGGTYTEAQSITMTCATPAAQIRYTLDGSDPLETSPLYSGPITVANDVTIKAKAFRTNWIASTVATETYVVSIPTQVIQGTANTIQHINVAGDFILKFNNLNNKDVYFVFSNQNESASVILPQLQSSVATANNVVDYTPKVSQASSFPVSGKPSVTQFNNTAQNQLKRGAISPLYQQQLELKSQNLEVGSSETLYDDTGNPINSTVRKVISANGKNLYVWVADNCWGPSSSKTYHVTQTMLDEFAPKFLSPGNDNDIYEWVTNAAGDPWGATPYNNLIAETDDIHIWLMDIDNDDKTTGTITLGYYFSRDNFLTSQYAASNEKLLFTIDAVLFGKTTNGSWSITDYWPMQLISTLAHEFTHMIYFYQKQVVKNKNANTAINEMSAQCVEDLVANKILADGPRGVPYATPSAGALNNIQGRLPLYNSNNYFTLLNWSASDAETLINYSKTYALGAYLMRNYGGANFIRELIQNNATGPASIVAAVNANGGAVSSYGDILQQFGVANLLSDRTDLTTGYKYNTGGWSSSTVNVTTYNLGSINLNNYSPTPKIYSGLPVNQQAGSNILYKAGSNLSGENEWLFEGVDANTKVTVVVK